jgi:hypothetical protein
MLVSADGTAATARNAFMTSFAQVKTRDGRIAYANTDDVRISAALSDKVLSVIGLQNVHQPRTATAPVKSSSGVHTDDVITHDPTEFPVIYGGTGAVDRIRCRHRYRLQRLGRQQRWPESGHHRPQYLHHQPQPANRHRRHFPTRWRRHRSRYRSGVGCREPDHRRDGRWPGEADHLLQPRDADRRQHDDRLQCDRRWQRGEARRGPQYGVCETDAQSDGSAAAQDAILETAVAQGQTFITGTGDSGGADQCGNLTNTPLWPTSSQYVIAVASTLLNASTTTWTSEQVYNQTGGSPSTFEPMPSWQTAFGVPGTTRGTADITFDGDP